MYKKLILSMIIISTSLFSRDLYIILDNDNSKSYENENFIVSDLFDKKILDSLQIANVKLVTNLARPMVFTVAEDDLPDLSDLQANDMGILESLEKLLSTKNYNPDDIVIFLSSMDYTDTNSYTSSKNRLYNDAWLTSDMSPIKRLMDKFDKNSLKNMKILIIDANKNIQYLKNRERFYSFLFSKFGAKLVYYGSLDFDNQRIIDYIKSNKNIYTVSQNPPINNEKYLMLDDRVIQYKLP